MVGAIGKIGRRRTKVGERKAPKVAVRKRVGIEKGKVENDAGIRKGA